MFVVLLVLCVVLLYVCFVFVSHRYVWLSIGKLENDNGWSAIPLFVFLMFLGLLALLLILLSFLSALLNLSFFYFLSVLLLVFLFFLVLFSFAQNVTEGYLVSSAVWYAGCDRYGISAA